MPDLPPAYRLVALESVGSTNEEAKRLARAGAEDGMLVWAKEQTAGRGRRGNAWTSPAGNLYTSLVLRPEVPPARFGELGFVAALAIGETLGAFVEPLTELRYKWPNDVLLNGSKASGILLEGESGADWLVLGIGINVAHHPEGATSIRAEGGAEATVETVLDRFSRAFLAWANRWLDDGFRRSAPPGCAAPSRSARRSRCASRRRPCAAASPTSTATARCSSTRPKAAAPSPPARSSPSDVEKPAVPGHISRNGPPSGNRHAARHQLRQHEHASSRVFDGDEQKGVCEWRRPTSQPHRRRVRRLADAAARARRACRDADIDGVHHLERRAAGDCSI